MSKAISIKSQKKYFFGMQMGNSKLPKKKLKGEN
jgi:hypothetical protein